MKYNLIMIEKKIYENKINFISKFKKKFKLKKTNFKFNFKKV